MSNFTNPQNTRGSASTIANKGVRLLKKLVYENYDEPMQERRQHERQSIAGEATVSITDPTGKSLGDTRVFIRDSSRNGCGLWSRVEMPVGSTVMLNVVSGEGQPGTQRLGRVRHCRGASGSGFAIGVQFNGGGQGQKKAG